MFLFLFLFCMLFFTFFQPSVAVLVFDGFKVREEICKCLWEQTGKKADVAFISLKMISMVKDYWSFQNLLGDHDRMKHAKQKLMCLPLGPGDGFQHLPLFAVFHMIIRYKIEACVHWYWNQWSYSRIYWLPRGLSCVIGITKLTIN